ncbi:MAG: ammonium transporter [Methanomicrobiales archaeon]
MPIDSGDTAWILASTALVMLMIPGVGPFYGGLVRKKNLISVIALAFIVLAVVSHQWVLVGYSLAFGGDMGGLIGGLEFLELSGMGPGGDGIPALLFVAFQLVFAALTLAIMTSGFAERVKISEFIIFALLWTTLVYDPLAHWAWGGGWAAQLGALDFAGGTMVHISSGFGALAAALVIGKRIGFDDGFIEPHNIPLTLVGAGLLWFGWFGFNAGSALAADGLAANALLVTNTAAAAGATAWLCASSVHGKPNSVGIVSGAVAGLVGITPAAGYVDAMGAIAIGAVAGLLCYGALLFRLKKKLDESLYTWAIHGVGGFWGALATGIFATAAIGGLDGLIHGNAMQFGIQCVDAVIAAGFAFAATGALALLVDRTIGLRVTETEEYVGLDISQHGERIP